MKTLVSLFCLVTYLTCVLKYVLYTLLNELIHCFSIGNCLYVTFQMDSLSVSFWMLWHGPCKVLIFVICFCVGILLLLFLTRAAPLLIIARKELWFMNGFITWLSGRIFIMMLANVLK